jgi:hypothetical protein
MPDIDAPPPQSTAPATRPREVPDPPKKKGKKGNDGDN